MCFWIKDKQCESRAVCPTEESAQLTTDVRTLGLDVRRVRAEFCIMVDWPKFAIHWMVRNIFTAIRWTKLGLNIKALWEIINFPAFFLWLKIKNRDNLMNLVIFSMKYWLPFLKWTIFISWLWEVASCHSSSLCTDETFVQSVSFHSYTPADVEQRARDGGCERSQQLQTVLDNSWVLKF